MGGVGSDSVRTLTGVDEGLVERLAGVGDLNVAFGSRDDDPFVLREHTVTYRLDAAGLELLGPQSADGR